MSLPVHKFHYSITVVSLVNVWLLILFYMYSIYDKLHFLYVGGSHVATLECLYDCPLDNMFLLCRNKLILILCYNVIENRGEQQMAMFAETSTSTSNTYVLFSAART